MPKKATKKVTKKGAKKASKKPSRTKYHVDKKDTYRVMVNGPLAEALYTLHQELQKNRKFRRLAAGDLHELARECLDRGMLELEQELYQETGHFSSDEDFSEIPSGRIRG